MLKPFLFVFKKLREGKGIPHGGLGTKEVVAMDVKELVSPSHTVGLERAIREYEYEKSKLSPSHTVGLERPDFFYRRRKIGSVTIPHGGLGTRTYTA